MIGYVLIKNASGFKVSNCVIYIRIPKVYHNIIIINSPIFFILFFNGAYMICSNSFFLLACFIKFNCFFNYISSGEKFSACSCNSKGGATSHTVRKIVLYFFSLKWMPKYKIINNSGDFTFRQYFACIDYVFPLMSTKYFFSYIR